MSWSLFSTLWILAVALAAAFAFRWHNTRNLRRMSNAELESLVFRFHPDYFRRLGMDNPSVTEFRSLVGARDVDQIQRRWTRLAKVFIELEVAHGLRGRPELFEHYGSYPHLLHEFRRRAAG